MRSLLLASLLAALTIPPLPAAAQLLYAPADHWSAEALMRLDAFSEPHARVPWGFGALPRGEVLAIFEELAEDADGELPPALVRLARSYRHRFGEELRLGGDDDPGWGPLRWAGAHADARGGRRSGTMATGSGHPPPGVIVPPEPWDDGSFAGSVGAAVTVGPVGFAGAVRTGPDGSGEVGELYGAGRLGPVDVWGGRRAPAFGGSVGGTVVLDGRVPIDGGGFALARPLVLPSFLRYLGPIRFETHAARFDESGEVGRPWFWTARGSFSPHPTITLAVNRGAIFGGEGSPPMTARHLIRTIIGSREDDPSGEFPTSAFANQIASGEARVRLPIESAPVTWYMEWGMEDSAGAWLNVPGIIIGAHVAALPGASGLSLGLERTYFARSCCQNPPWYRHGHFEGGWADRGLMLGHPLGGDGGEWLVHGRADLYEARLRSSWRLFHRERGEENLYAPDRLGTSVGGAVEAAYRVAPWADLVLDLHVERGTGDADWNEVIALVGVRGFF